MRVYPIRCKIQAGSHSTRVDVYDDIGGGMFGGISSSDFASTLARTTGPLDVHINSGGGVVFEGMAIAEALRTYKGRVTTYVDGLAASVASVVAQGGIERVMAPGSMMMIHDAYTTTEGNAREHEKNAKVLDTVSDTIADIYSRRAGGAKNDWRTKMLAETWYTAEEAVAAGLADRVGGESAEWPKGLEAAAFAGAPERIMASIRMLSNRASLRIRAAQMHGDHELWDPDGDGDCDACPEGDTDHGYWDENGNQLKPVPGKPMPGTKPDGVKPAPGKAKLGRPIVAGVDTSPWDADKAMAAGAASDDPAAFYKGICAGKREGDPSKQDTWALPYRYAPDKPVNAAAVRTALARLSSTQGLINAAKARKTLEKAMKQVNPDWQPDNSIDPELLAAALGGALKGGIA